MQGVGACRAYCIVSLGFYGCGIKIPYLLPSSLGELLDHSSFVILRRSAGATGGPSGARERDPGGSTAVRHILPEQVAFGAAGSPGLAALAGG